MTTAVSSSALTIFSAWQRSQAMAHSSIFLAVPSPRQTNTRCMAHAATAQPKQGIIISSSTPRMRSIYSTSYSLPRTGPSLPPLFARSVEGVVVKLKDALWMTRTVGSSLVKSCMVYGDIPQNHLLDFNQAPRTSQQPVALLTLLTVTSSPTWRESRWSMALRRTRVSFSFPVKACPRTTSISDHHPMSSSSTSRSARPRTEKSMVLQTLMESRLWVALLGPISPKD